MTHDELLAKIDEGFVSCTCENASWGGGCYSDENIPYKALRAVVELHKPWTATEDDRYWGGFRQEIGDQCCPACAMPSIYPCPTIQAIEEQLK